MDRHTATEMAFKNGYEKGYEAGKPKWIPVSERLPGEYKTVLVYIEKHDDFGVCYYDPCWREFYTTHNTLTGFITHWMPLPEPPKERNDG